MWASAQGTASLLNYQSPARLCCHMGALILLIVVLGIVSFLFKYLKTYRDLVKAGLPTVFWRPRFVTYDLDTKKLRSSNITNILPRMQKLKGPYGLYGTVYGTAKVVHVAHPMVAQTLLGASQRRFSKQYNTTGTTKAPGYNHFKSFCGEGVFTADGEDWKQKRGAVLHALMRQRDFQSDVSKQAERAFSQLRSDLDGVASANIVPILQRATLGLIYRYITHQELEFQTVSNEQPGLFSSYLASITRIRMIILAQSRSVWFLLPRWCYERLSSLFKDESRTMIPIRTFSQMACVNAEPGSPLDQLKQLDLYKDNPKNLIDEAITLLFAGQDTSAATLSWTLHLLSLYPDVQSRLADEVCSVLDDSDETLSKPIASRMPFLDAVIKEAMRVYPVAPFVVRKLEEAVELAPPDENWPTKTLTLPSGALACIWIYSLHRHPDYWDRPDEFMPERWLEDAKEMDLGISTPGAYIPFAAGPRSCVGQPLANIILRSLLARLVYRYEFQDDRVLPGVDVTPLRKDMQAGFTVLPEGGLTMSIKRRVQEKA